MKIRKISSVLCAAGIVAGLLSGCGGEYETAFHGGAESVSGTAVNVTEQAVSGQAVNSHKTEKSHRFCTDTNLYYDYGDGVAYTRLDGTQEKKIKLKKYFEILGINKGYLYYVTEETETNRVYRIPVEKDRAGWDIVRTDQEENVIPVEEKEVISYVWGMNSEYIFYTTITGMAEDKMGLVQYNIESGEKILLEDIVESYIVTDSYLIGCGEKNVFVKDMNGKEWLKVSDYVDPWKSIGGVWNENAFFYTTPSTEDWNQSTAVRKCDLTDSEDQEFISKKKLRQKAVEAEGIEMDEVDICGVLDLFLEEDRLYVQVQLNWRREGTYHVGVLMFSQGVEETELRYEKEITECLKMYGATRKGEWRDTKVWEKNMLINDSHCFSIVNGKAFLWIYDAKNKYGRVGCYELEQGTFRWLSENQSEYYEPLYDKQDYLDHEYTPDEPAYFLFYNKCGAWGPMDERGEFYEDSEN